MIRYISVIDSETKNESIVEIDAQGIAWGLSKDPESTKYQAYLKWLEEGNTPLPADEVTQ
jgi:hypothetical protein